MLNVSCGEGGIRTPGAFQLNSFQDCRNRPLYHLSNMPFNFIKAVSGNCFFLETAFILCGGRRSRTDDPLLAKQVL